MMNTANVLPIDEPDLDLDGDLELRPLCIVLVSPDEPTGTSMEFNPTFIMNFICCSVKHTFPGVSKLFYARKRIIAFLKFIYMHIPEQAEKRDQEKLCHMQSNWQAFSK